MKQKLFCVAGLTFPIVGLSLVLAVPVSGQSIRVRYDPQSTVALGSSLNVLNYDQALGDCIAFADDDVKFDNTGATSTRIKVSIASSYEEVINELSRDLSLTSPGLITSVPRNATITARSVCAT